MSVPAKTHQTYAARTLREDLSDIADRLSPTETPFMTAVKSGSATAVYHEWTVVDLAAATDDNAVVEGDDPPNDDATTGNRLGNYTQLSDKVAQVSSTAEAVKGVADLQTMSQQIAMKVLELKRDMEKQMLSNKAANPGTASVARQSASFISFLRTNVSRGAGGANPTLSGTVQGYPNAAPTDGTARPFTEAVLKSVIQGAWNEGGQPTLCFLPAAQKVVASGFAGNATRMKEAEDKKLIAAIDVYVSDFGELQLVPDRFMRPRDVVVVDPERVSLAYLKKMRQEPLAKTGHSEKRMVSVEYTLKCHNEKAHGHIADLV